MTQKSPRAQMLKSYPNEQYRMSSEGLQNILQSFDYDDITKNINWTDDYRVQLPIRVASQGLASIPPRTIIQAIQKSVQMHGKYPALSKKVNGQWVTYTFHEYYNQIINFAKGLIQLRIPEFTGINIIGFNAPEWNIAFFGTIFARCIPVGIYSTNNQQTCEYIFRHSNSKVVVAQNFQYAKKYMNLLKSNELVTIILYNDEQFQIPQQFKGIIKHWKDFMKESQKVQLHQVQSRMNKIKPGNCASLVYTSGTTGLPKGVLISHDNYTWVLQSLVSTRKTQAPQNYRLISYLPLSHVAGQFIDIILGSIEGAHVYFADPTALQGTLLQNLLEVKPHFFFTVPRVWQKIYQKMQQISRQNGWLKTKIATWAKEKGLEETMNYALGQKVSLGYKIANRLIFAQIKKNLGLEQCLQFSFGAAPLNPDIRKYFLSIGIPLVNGYGMSQSTGVNNATNLSILKKQYETLGTNDLGYFKETGINLPGTQIKIVKENQNDEDGQICYRGRNTFMGYYKNPQQTKKTIDKDGFLHSGDVGVIKPNGLLFITGRAKELIVTAGGQNIPPILIQNQLFKHMPFLSNIMVVGDNKKYLTCLIALKEDPPGSGTIEKVAFQYLNSRNCQVRTIQQARNSDQFKKIVMEGLQKANQKAISRAQNVQFFYLLPEQFSIDNGLLTPTMKTKRKQVIKRYANQIQTMYLQPKL